ncbi:hypothetical protein C6341_g25042 [Phytophthora cactorum]|nr:hypothetical protein C6341_g25042 [Phytophthora cactorum]
MAYRPQAKQYGGTGGTDAYAYESTKDVRRIRESE